MDDYNFGYEDDDEFDEEFDNEPDEENRCVICGEPDCVEACVCGAPLCPMHFETGAGFCRDKSKEHQRIVEDAYE